MDYWVEHQFLMQNPKYKQSCLLQNSKYKPLHMLSIEPLDDAIVLELDQMEKSSDIDDILSYRSAAEHEIQDFLVDSAINIRANESNTAFDKLVDDDQLSSKPQGWVMWLSRCMLGAGGTDDSRQFSGVVSDEVIKVYVKVITFKLKA
ncbi:hypothetical protein E3N88_11657 [Mikania micrantha]|uniref:Uncharacterized protein n=1 Tax=Mikania micrantha TaxID=192012 RepID=A0A5N6P4R7_9ASTR|nr:hypothetical protein E3N88_11657 [Mikania micrantha]